MYCVASECWTQYNDVHGFGGRPLLGITVADRCKLSCLRNTSCVAIDHDPGNLFEEYCWLLTNTVIDRAPGITHYVLNRTCAGKRRLQYKTWMCKKFSEYVAFTAMDLHWILQYQDNSLEIITSTIGYYSILPKEKNQSFAIYPWGGDTGFSSPSVFSGLFSCLFLNHFFLSFNSFLC